jgi:D-3-phosphoglycerate dehydrogenase / 2-oxoglutarate reductase
LILPHPEGVVITRYTILVADNVHSSALDVLASNPELDVLMPDAATREAVLAKIAGADGLLIRSATKVDREMLEAAPKLKAIGRAGVGVDNVDLPEATARGIVVMNTPDGNTIATAEYTFGILLAMLRQIPQAHQSMNEGRWDRKNFMGMELRGKTLGIIGLGRIGRAVARRALAFEMNVIAYDAYDAPREIARAEGLGVDLIPLEDLLAKADVITLHPSLEDTTRGMINKDTLGKMRRGVYLVNAARGGLIVDADLAKALKSGQVAGAAIDVYDQEPPKPDNPLLSAPNILHTPHLAASTEDAQITVAVDAAKLLARGLIENEYRNVVNPLAFEQRA